MDHQSVGRPSRLAVLTVVVAATALIATACVSHPPTTHPTAIDTIVISGETVTVSVPEGMTVTVESADMGPLPAPPTGFTAPLGALSIEVGNLSPPGASVEVTIQLENPVGAVRKLIGGAWDPFTPDGTTGATLSPDGKTITVDLVDGGRGDSDGATNGQISDPILPLDSDEVQILTSGTPAITIGTPYSFQLTAGGPTPAAITWSILWGALPAGLSMDTAGLISGTPNAPGVWAVRVQATDGATTDTKLLLFAWVQLTTSATSTGTPLPDGTSLTASYGEVGEQPTFIDYDAGGNLTVRQEITPTMGLGFSVNPAGTLLVGYWAAPYDLLDADTGALVRTLFVMGPGDTPTGAPAFSPNGELVMVPLTSGVRIYEVDTGDLVRNITPAGWYPKWATNAEIMSIDLSGVYFDSASLPATSRTVSAPGCTFVVASEATQRMALACGDSLRIMGLDGSDERIISDGCERTANWCPNGGSAASPRFSPSGSHLAYTAVRQTQSGLDTALMVTPDAAGNPDAITIIEGEPLEYFNVLAWR